MCFPMQDYGGFSRFDMSPKPKLTIVNLDDVIAKEKLEMEQAAVEAAARQRALSALETKQSKEVKEVQEDVSVTVSMNTSSQEDEEGFLDRDPAGFSGAFMM